MRNIIGIMTVLKMIYSEGCIALFRLLKITKDYWIGWITWNGWILWCVKYGSIHLFLKKRIKKIHIETAASGVYLGFRSLSELRWQLKWFLANLGTDPRFMLSVRLFLINTKHRYFFKCLVMLPRTAISKPKTGKTLLERPEPIHTLHIF